MNTADLSEIIANLRDVGGEPAEIEAKSALGGIPQSLRQTLSAFSNTDGGIILLGIDENTGFSIVELPDPIKLRDQLMQMSRDDLTPPLRIRTDILEIEGKFVVIAEVPPVTPDLLPVYVTSRGVTGGSYLRSGDGDRLLTHAEIALLVSARSQPTYDHESVPGTTVADLNQDSLRRTLARVRANFPKLGLNDDTTILYRLGITSASAPESALTLAGLLSFGEFPQQFFPQLMVSIVSYATPQINFSATRFLDNVTARGSIPEIVDTCLHVIRRNLAVRALITERGTRVDELEFPLEAVRESIVNALLHRDYSPVTRGTQIQVELFPDRLIIRSPGGLYGGISAEDLGQRVISTSRNALLASLLSETYLPGTSELVTENRASGIPAIFAATREYGLPLPSFTATITTFTVEFSRTELFTTAVNEWITGLGYKPLSQSLKVALAMLHRANLTPAMLRNWGINQPDLTKVLRELVTSGLAVKKNTRRSIEYALNPNYQPPKFTSPKSGMTVSQSLQTQESASTTELSELTGLSRTTVLNQLHKLMAAGLVAATSPARSPKNRYRWIGVATTTTLSE